jgi:phage gp36-like protein
MGAGMSQYCTIDDLRVCGVDGSIIDAVLALYADPDDGTAAITALCEQWSARVDGYLSGRYVLPLLVHGKDITLVTSHLTAFDLLIVHKMLLPNQDDYTIWKDRVDYAYMWLEQVRDGKIVPTGVTDAGVDPDDEGSSITIVGRPIVQW